MGYLDVVEASHRRHHGEALAYVSPSLKIGNADPQRRILGDLSDEESRAGLDAFSDLHGYRCPCIIAIRKLRCSQRICN